MAEHNRCDRHQVFSEEVDGEKEYETTDRECRVWAEGFLMRLIARTSLLVAALLSVGQCLAAQEIGQPVVLEIDGLAEASSTVEIIPEIDGAILEAVSTIGRRVKRGDVLMRIDPESYEIVVERARTRLKFARIQHDAVTKELKRLEDLFAKRLTTKDIVYTTSLAAQLAQADLQDAEVDLRAAELQLAETVIRAPIDGVVSRINVNVGDVVGRSTDPAFVLISYDPIRVKVSIDQKSDLVLARDILAGRTELEKVVLKLPDQTLYRHQGEYIGSSHQVDPANGKVAHYFTFPNEDLLILPGTSVTAIINIQTTGK